VLPGDGVVEGGDAAECLIDALDDLVRLDVQASLLLFEENGVAAALGDQLGLCGCIYTIHSGTSAIERQDLVFLTVRSIVGDEKANVREGL